MSDVNAYGSKQGNLIRECFWLIVTTEEWTMRKTTKIPGEKVVKDFKRADRCQVSHMRDETGLGLEWGDDRFFRGPATARLGCITWKASHRRLSKMAEAF